MKQETVTKIFEIINTDAHKISTIQTIINAYHSNKVCKVYLFDDIFLETDREDFEEISSKYFPTLLENEEYELCHELTKIYPTIKPSLSN